MHFTSVLGHLMNYSFSEENEKWEMEKIKQLYHTNMVKKVKDDNQPILKTLQAYAGSCDTLILWLDCDREGENIAYEVVDVVKKKNPKIKILRAKFSALTKTEIQHALDNLEKPNANIAYGVDLRQKIDLLIGASFTRLQTLAFRNVFANLSKLYAYNVISYGPCQFPTLNFIVDRAMNIENFKPEEFYYLDLVIKNTKFIWSRHRLFDKDITQTLYEKITQAEQGRVVKVKTSSIKKYRPIPLNTVEMQKLVSTKLKISSHLTMDIAEKLYQKGYISYPRTETQKYSQPLALITIVKEISSGNGYQWNKYAKNLITSKEFTVPREGKEDDKAHPPIHPVRYVDPQSLTSIERKIYELIVVHFLACVSPNAIVDETLIEANIEGETFIAKGLTFKSLGYLRVYPYDASHENQIDSFIEGETFKIDSECKVTMKDGETTPPYHLSEAELITLMHKNGIGTDSTIHEHIKHVVERGYAFKTGTGTNFKPSNVGVSLIKAYEYIGVDLYKPFLRAAMERDIKKVCEGEKEYKSCYNDMKTEMEKIFDTVYDKVPMMVKFLQNSTKEIKEEQFKSSKEKNTLESKCLKCNSLLKTMRNKRAGTFFLGCSRFPSCSFSFDIGSPSNLVGITEDKCEGCNSISKYKLEFTNKAEIKCLGQCLTNQMANSQNKSNKKKINKKNQQSKKEDSVRTENDTAKVYKCTVCGIEKRHPKGSKCEGMKKKKNLFKSNDDNFLL